jgi:serine protease Do
MKSVRLAMVAVLASATVALFALGIFDARIQFGAGDAQAIDLFGSEEKEQSPGQETAAEPFWKESEGALEAVPPPGAPASFADLAEHVSPAIVNIQTSTKVGGQSGRRPRHPLEEFFGPPFREFFGPERSVPSLGTGFAISEDGYIITNDHVIAEVDKIEVHFMEGEVLEAEVVGRDPKTDVALIRVETDEKLPFLSLGDSDSVRPGDWVVAIGNPFGLEHTVTAGIVSAKHRNINTDPESRRFDDFLQTDAAINPGNSGGPLINLKGEVVGIATAINPRANTIGFAVPINIAKQILPQLRTAGRVSRGWLGVYIQAIDEDTAELMDLKDMKGALVSKVEPGAPADEAGIERGDVIVEFDGKPVEEMDELPRIVAATPVGSKVEVKALRKGKKKSFTVQLGELEAGERVAGAQREEAPGAYGLHVQDIGPDMAEHLDLETAEGVLIVTVEPGSPAEGAGLRRGDVILEVNQSSVSDVREFSAALKDSEKGALLLVRRGNAEIFIPLKRPE